MNPTQLHFGLAFVAGLASFLSPCVLPLVPIYLGQLVGQSIYQAKQEASQRFTTFLHAASFVGGFTLMFIALGATASVLGSFLREHQVLLRQIGGVILCLIGLHLTGLLRLPFLYTQKRFSYRPSRPSYPASFLIGVIFALGWSPCIGPILGAILVLAADAETLRQGIFLLLLYSLGLGIPFLLLGLGVNQLSKLLTRLKPYLGKIEIATGVLMIVAGIVIFFNLLTLFNSFFNIGLS
ncbi:cytochrome c-type biogenesis protein [Thermosporothrix hazakensis]|jgi:cytochrome c-type biogenesis protein|uniref:Cytochrome c-type biogenesis protein n=2 Tax=Thermosporothrix TaxID=768650 RepID=A0A326UBW9_THEHA|nr:cytochrome c biogenesis CcdA family protein [Thermosporothrix hazakensis]PZW35868.1 cytochrome c-type biogenesis protein [Thermosporothrix hazakensis]BBH88335.1 cytochrome C biogenesis protein CcdA [Thermosporothrix sp. COM3]GCE46521.1 cytochrome C biogenesis protein CcdA [Thermosporothrix hazakensis]